MDEPPWPDGYEYEVEPVEGAGAYSFRTRDGLTSKTEPRGAELALLDAIEPGEGDALVPDANYGVVGTTLAGAGDRHVTMLETSARAAACCRINAQRNGATDVDVQLVPWGPAGDRSYDLLAYAPEQYAPTAVNRRRLLRCLSAVAPGGTCYVAGSPAADVGRYAATLEAHCTDVEEVAIDGDLVSDHDVGDLEVYRATRPEPFEPEDPVEEHEFRATVGEYTCRFLTLPGLFSWEDVDAGTAALLREADVPEGSRVLDLACGYGAVGAFVGARTDCELHATDDDVVATTLARRNYERNGVTPAAVETGDCLDAVADRTFDVVLTNPPTHAGKGVTWKLFEDVRDALAPDGEFWLVYNEIMEYDRTLRERFDFDVEVVSEGDSFVVARATR